MALGHLLYISDAKHPMGRTDLSMIRTASAQYNARYDITGVLFYSAGHFVQLLEGELAEIRKLFESIKRDPRHSHVRLLVDRTTDQRIFADWDMGLLDLDRHEETRRRDLEELVRLAGSGTTSPDGTPIEMEILSRFCMLLPPS